MTEPLVRIPDGAGYRYERGGRPWICSQHCEGCGELGAYTDTGLCDECEEVAAGHAEALRAAFRAGQERMRERALAELDKKEPPESEFAAGYNQGLWVTAHAIRALPLEEAE